MKIAIKLKNLHEAEQEISNGLKLEESILVHVHVFDMFTINFVHSIN